MGEKCSRASLRGAEQGIRRQLSGRGRRPLKGSPPPAAQTARADFPQAAFTMTRLRRAAMEGIKPTRFTSRSSP